VADFDDVIDRLRAARRVAALTGAGVSSASGVPTFRGADGLWKNVRSETLATPEAFENDPKLVWEWYDWRRSIILNARPNAAHEILARWTQAGREPDTAIPHTSEPPAPQASSPKPQAFFFSLITQNVDGLHERAGAEGLLRLHGSIWHVRCGRPCAAGRFDWLDTTVPQPRIPPTCPHCGSLVRPAVVWFGEPLDPTVFERANHAAAAADVFLVVGTSAVVYPAAGLVHVAKDRGAFTVEINTMTTAVSRNVDASILGPAAETLSRIDDALRR
jgi:NAD-dependent deacetylase